MTFPCKKMRNDALHKINKHAYIEIGVICILQICFISGLVAAPAGFSYNVYGLYLV